MSTDSEKDMLRKQIYGNMNLKDTDELLTIWRKGDHKEWTETAFEVVEEILLARLGEIPPEEEHQDTDPGGQVMTNTDSPTPTQDERVMAGLSHVSALLPLMGIIAPIVIWVTQKEKSKYVAFQSLQALAYQLVMVLAWFIGMGCYMLSFFGTFISIPFASSSGNSQSVSPLFGLAFLIPFLVFGLIFLGGFAFMIYGFIGAVLAFQGKPFRYAVIGRRVEHFMQPKQETATNEHTPS